MDSEPMSDKHYAEIIADTEEFMRQRAAWKTASIVRGRFNADWSDEIARLKRSGDFEEALALVYECMDAAERAGKVGPRMGSTWGAWILKAAIILRKMKDHPAEVRLLEQASDALPANERITARLATARQILARHS